MAAFLQGEATAELAWGLPLEDEKEEEEARELPQVNVVRRLISLPALQQADPQRARELVPGSQALHLQSADGLLPQEDNTFSGSAPFWHKESQLRKSVSGCLPIAEVAASELVQEADEATNQVVTKEAAGKGVNKATEEAAQAVTKGAATGAKPFPVQRRAEISAPLVLQKSGLRVAVACNGSVGDTLPLLTLALQLMQFHHTVCMFTSVNLVPLCRENGVEAVPIFADTYAVLSSIGGMVEDLNEGLELSVKASKAWMEKNPKACVNPDDALNDFKPHAIVSGAAALLVSLTHEHKEAAPVVPVFLCSKAIEEFKSYCTLKPKRPSLYACSNFMSHRPIPIMPGLHVTSEWVLYRMPSEESLAEGGKFYALQRFLQTGSTPIYVGWGSMLACGLQPVEMLGLVLRALRRTAYRAVVLGGWAELDRLADELASGSLQGIGPDLPELAAMAAERACFVREVPHEWLFPQVCAVVHHGGVGTTQAALRAGKPSVITPVFADQFKHAEIVERLEVGVGFQTPLARLKAEELADAINSVESKTAKADSLGQKMRAQTGERDAAVSLDKFFRKEVETGAWARSMIEQKGKSKGRGKPGGRTLGGAIGKR